MTTLTELVVCAVMTGIYLESKKYVLAVAMGACTLLDFVFIAKWLWLAGRF